MEFLEGSVNISRKSLPAASAAGTALGPLPGKQVPGERHPLGSVFCLSSGWLFPALLLLHLLLLLILLPASPCDSPPSPKFLQQHWVVGQMLVEHHQEGPTLSPWGASWRSPPSHGVRSLSPSHQHHIWEPCAIQGKLRQPQVGTRPCSKG